MTTQMWITDEYTCENCLQWIPEIESAVRITHGRCQVDGLLKKWTNKRAAETDQDVCPLKN